VIVKRLVGYAMASRRHGVLALEAEIDQTSDEFLRNALLLVSDGTTPKTTRQILDVENQARRAAAEVPADVLETAAGYTPTLGILGAVLGLIRVMQNLGEPSKLGIGIAVAFVATVYGVAAANLLLLPLATKLRARARDEAVHREVIIEGMVALQEGLNPRLIEQQLRSYVTPARTASAVPRAA
jgi:chemotaxis protein MotA